MPRVDSFVKYTLELMEPLGPVQARAMFGGWGLYHGGRMFGLIVEGRLYLKTDDITRPAFQAVGCEPFVYDSGKGKPPVTMCYWTPPADASDDAYALLPWVRRAVEAADRATARKSLSPRKRRGSQHEPPGVSRGPDAAVARNSHDLSGVVNAFCAQVWSGNVRELRNSVDCAPIPGLIHGPGLWGAEEE